MVKFKKIYLHELAIAINLMKENEFDCFIIIEGKRGLGKSTLAYKLCRSVVKKRFIPERDILFTRNDVIRAFHKRWNSQFIADEMINVTFNRDFWSEDQKTLVKLINMNRDHCNLFIACVPQFSTLDRQIQNLCKIRITVIRRGLCVIHTPNKSIYSKDIWDTSINERIERRWIEGKTKPRYHKLTTFRAVMRFSKLTDKQEYRYQKIKIDKRNDLLNRDEKSPEVLSFLDRLYQELKKGNVSKQILQTYATIMGKREDTVRLYLNQKLQKIGKRRVKDYLIRIKKIEPKTKNENLLPIIRI